MERITSFIVRHFRLIAVIGAICCTALVLHNLLAWDIPLKIHLRNYAILLTVSGVIFHARARFGAPTEFRVGSSRNVRGFRAPFPVYFAGIIAIAVYLSITAFKMIVPVEPIAVFAVFISVISIPE